MKPACLFLKVLTTRLTAFRNTAFMFHVVNTELVTVWKLPAVDKDLERSLFHRLFTFSLCPHVVESRKPSHPCSCHPQPDNPTEFVSKVYEMMAVALDAKRKQRQEDLEKLGSPKAPEQPKAEPAGESTNENVVEASQVLTEEDPWKQ